LRGTNEPPPAAITSTGAVIVVPSSVFSRKRLSAIRSNDSAICAK
jgi:hypothetical protein